MIFRQKRKPRQNIAGLIDDDSQESSGNPKIKEVHRHMIRKKTRKYHLIEIQPVAKQNQGRHKRHQRPISLGTPAHINQERSKEIDDQVQPENRCIWPLQTLFEINRFFRHIRIPDQHKLAKPQIGPEDGECELELAEIVQMFFIRQLQVSFILEIDYKNGDQRNT